MITEYGFESLKYDLCIWKQNYLYYILLYKRIQECFCVLVEVAKGIICIVTNLFFSIFAVYIHIHKSHMQYCT